MSNHKKLIDLGFYALFFLIMLILFYRFTIQNRDRIQEQNLAYAEDALQQIGDRLAEQLHSSLDLVETYAYFIGDTLTSPVVGREKLRELEENSPFDGLRFTNLAGKIFTADGKTADVYDREFFRLGVQGRSGSSVIMKSRIFQKPILDFYAPIYHDGRIIGVLDGAYISDKYMKSMLENSYFGEAADLYFCLPSGEIVASSNGEGISENIIALLSASGILNENAAKKGEEIFRSFKSGALQVETDSDAGNVYILHMNDFGYFLVQAFPQKVAATMVERANKAGFELEAGLLLLFACCALLLMTHAAIQKKKLEKKNHQLGQIINGMNILFEGRYCLVDLDSGRYIYISQQDLPDSIEEPQGDLIQIIQSRAAEMVDPESAEDFINFFNQNHLKEIMRNSDTSAYLCHIRRNGKEEWENVITACLEREGDIPRRFLMVRQNVTEMKLREIQARKKISTMNRKERQYQLALTSNALCSYEINLTKDLIREDVIGRYNGAASSLMKEAGLSAPCRASAFLDALGTLALPESFPEYQAKANVPYLLAQYAKGHREVDLEYWSRSSYGEEICIRQAFFMAKDEETGDVMAMTVCRDITALVLDRRMQTKALQDALLLAQHANEAKTTFLSNMSHDIRTPMNAIIGFATIAAAHLDNKNQVRDCLQKVLSSSNHLLSLINDILDMSRIESGKMQIKEQECNIPELMHNLVTIIQPQVKAKQMQLFIDTFAVANENVITDPLKITQVFVNLLGNAVKYTPAGGTITFRLGQKPAFKHGWADYVFEVRDNGIGMTPEFLQHIFEPFTRETTSTLSGIQGTGLGMAITKNIIEMLNGSIEVQSAPGEGSVFTVTLTLKIQDTTDISNELKTLKGLHVLVVDDDFHVCDSVSKMLKSLDLRPEWTTSGKEAVYRTELALADNDPYATFIVDWQMPGMNGVETARKLRNVVGAEAAIIILTAYEWTDIEEEARAAGVTAFCAKPLFLSDLKNALITTHNLEDDKQELVADTGPQFKNARILVVDDLEMNREIAEFILAENGFLVETAPDGTDAVKAVSSAPEGYFDAILMDVQMPTMNGYEATRAIRNLEREDVKSLPIIAMTANALEEDKAAALKCGMNDHIAKPIDIKKFFEALKKYFK